MGNSTYRLALLVVLVVASPAAADGLSPDLAKIERRIGKEPVYQGKPGYLLLVFGPEAKQKVWLVRDGEKLYVDRHGTGDLSQPACRVTGEVDRYRERLFEAGDVTLGGKRYEGLRVAECSAKRFDEMPMFKEFLA